MKNKQRAHDACFQLYKILENVNIYIAREDRLMVAWTCRRELGKIKGGREFWGDDRYTSYFDRMDDFILLFHITIQYVQFIFHNLPHYLIKNKPKKRGFLQRKKKFQTFFFWKKNAALKVLFYLKTIFFLSLHKSSDDKNVKDKWFLNIEVEEVPVTVQVSPASFQMPNRRINGTTTQDGVQIQNSGNTDK